MSKMESHSNYLANMCRICTNRAHTQAEIKAKKPHKYVAKYSDMINTLFGIDSTTDNKLIHPNKICTACYQLLLNSKKTGDGNSMRGNISS